MRSTAQSSNFLICPPKRGAYVSGKATQSLKNSMQGFVGFRVLEGDAGSTFGAPHAGRANCLTGLARIGPPEDRL
jgi:hypothetical protein